MPFRSEKQRRYLWKNHPKIARDWTDTYGSKPQPKKKAEGGFIKRRMQLAGPKELKKIIKEMEKNKFVRRRLKLSIRKAEGGTIRKRHATGRNTAYELADLLKGGDRITSQDIKRAQTVLKGKSKNEWTALRTALEKQKKAKEALTGKSPSYLTGKEKAKEHKEKLKKLLKKGKGYVDEWMGKKKGGSIKKNGPVRPIHIPWDSQKKKKGGIMEPYRGSYISGKVDGKMLSNPSLRKYYKGLI